jgi:energy-coupling factor transport system permease protein
MERRKPVNFLNQIPIGQYVPGHSFVHRLDPRSKLIFVVLYVLFAFWVDKLYSFEIFFGYLLIAIFVSRISPKYLLKSLKPILWLIALTGIINFFFSNLSHEVAIQQTVIISCRLLLLFLMASLLTLTTSPIDLTDGIERLLQPLRRIGVPAHELAMMMSVALRFIPTLLEETDKIMKAQISRGADFEDRNPVKKVKALIPLLVPLFISAFRRADELALAMESRGYRGAEGRTKLRELKWSRRDFILLLFTLIFISLIIWAKAEGV